MNKKDYLELVLDSMTDICLSVRSSTHPLMTDMLIQFSVLPEIAGDGYCVVMKVMDKDSKPLHGLTLSSHICRGTADGIQINY